VRILYAEDDVRMRALVRRGLSEEGHAVHVVADAAATLSTALAMPFDVIVLDVMLPDGSGIDVVRALRARAEMTPVLMLTARDTQADVVAGLDAGADDYLTKPFAFDVLLARLRALVRACRRRPIGSCAKTAVRSVGATCALGRKSVLTRPVSAAQCPCGDEAAWNPRHSSKACGIGPMSRPTRWMPLCACAAEDRA
jgi:DNA-binding response OmpR family regulator